MATSAATGSMTGRAGGARIRWCRAPGTLSAATLIGAILACTGCGGDAPIRSNGGGIPNRAPEAAIVAPAPGAIYEEGQTVVFEGHGVDPEDGLLPDSALVWSSDQDGRLGAGGILEVATLAIGPHLVLLEVTDSHGECDSASVPIVIEVAILELEWVHLAGGVFMMGSPDGEPGRFANEGPVHEVQLSAFDITTTEVTTNQYATWLETALGAGLVEVDESAGLISGSTAGAHPGRPYLGLAGSGLGYRDGAFAVDPGHENHPILLVTWYGADAFCRSNRWRLPSEAEWEYACRAGTETALYSGALTETECALDAGLDAIGWYCGNSGDLPHAVEQKQPNGFGLVDMSGNAAEWCNDWYDPLYYGISEREDPPGPENGVQKVARGGAWESWASFCRSARRIRQLPGYLDTATFGFRPVRE
jgi:formylglycine-generating enzyme required for sulfatase activity